MTENLSREAGPGGSTTLKYATLAHQTLLTEHNFKTKIIKNFKMMTTERSTPITEASSEHGAPRDCTGHTDVKQDLTAVSKGCTTWHKYQNALNCTLYMSELYGM